MSVTAHIRNISTSQNDNKSFVSCKESFSGFSRDACAPLAKGRDGWSSGLLRTRGPSIRIIICHRVRRYRTRNSQLITDHISRDSITGKTGPGSYLLLLPLVVLIISSSSLLQRM